MALPMTVVQFSDYVELALELEIEKLTKPELGTLGLPMLEEILTQIKKEIRSIASVANESSDERLRSAAEAYRKYLLTLRDIAGLKGQDFVSRREELGQRLLDQWDALREVWPYFSALVADKSGILDAPTLALEQISNAASTSEATLKKMVDVALNRAEAEAAKIEENARKTARGFSVVAAQQQFDHARVSLQRKAIVWGTLAALAFTSFIAFSAHVYRDAPAIFAERPGGHIASIPEAIYLTGIRITILTAIGALTTFCLKMLRAHLHMSEFNDHRRRVQIACQLLLNQLRRRNKETRYLAD